MSTREIINDGGDEDEDDDEETTTAGTITFANYQHMRSAITLPHHNVPVDIPHHFSAPTGRELLMNRDPARMPTARHSAPVVNGNAAYVPPVSPTPTAGSSRRGRGFGHLPIIEASTSPTPSEAASNRSGGTNHSTGTAFFRNYNDAAHQQSRAGVITPDLVFAEIGHGRGAEGGGYQSSGRWSGESVVLVSPPRSATYGSLPLNASVYGHPVEGMNAVLWDSSNSIQRPSPRTDAGSSSWTLVTSEAAASNEALLNGHRQHDSGNEPYTNGHDVDGRGRTAKRGHTFTAAEQYASSFLFGRGGGANGHSSEGPSGSSSRHRSADYQRVPSPH